jgi:serine/threonine protein kinase
MEQIGPYRILRKLGEGGMGVVYAAEDERLNRAVAIKTMRESVDESARERFFREARAAASVSHPNVCQLYDIGDTDGRPFLVMELLDGQSLADRLREGVLPLTDAMQIAMGTLTALDALHARGFVHRDLKPSNVFLTAHGVKILDFGLARETRPPAVSSESSPTVQGQSPLTLSGMIVGTPRYMAPEQVLGQPVDGRADLFSAGALLFEMISGKPPFDDDSAMRLLHAIVYEAPPNLAGSAAIAAINRILHRAMAKRPDDRYPTAAAMANDLRDVMLISDAAAPVVARRITRMIAMPLRILRSDPETDFLAFAIPEAITTTLAGVGSLIVRSSEAASRLGDLDPKTLAETADVDVALTGTLLRAGDQIRVTSQLIELPSGTVIWSQSSQTAMSDVFELQDRLTQKIVSSLELPLSEREARLVRRDVPANPRAHEFYLRAGQQNERPDGWAIARDLYQRALEEDPRYAPAWARLARIYLLLGKFGAETAKYYDLAESAARQALELNPDLATAHDSYAKIEVATGRAKPAMLRLLDRVQHGSSDPLVFAGLVMAFRYCGLLDASAAAHEQARRLDAKIPTSVVHTFRMMGRYEDALAEIQPERDIADEALLHEAMGHHDKAVAIFEERRRQTLATSATITPEFATFLEIWGATLHRDRSVIPLFDRFEAFGDPEGQYFLGRALVRLEEHGRALEFLSRAERNGFFCFPAFERDPWLDPLRCCDPRFVEILRRAESRTRDAARAFEDHAASRVIRVG